MKTTNLKVFFRIFLVLRKWTNAFGDIDGRNQANCLRDGWNFVPRKSKNTRSFSNIQTIRNPMERKIPMIVYSSFFCKSLTKDWEIDRRSKRCSYADLLIWLSSYVNDVGKFQKFWSLRIPVRGTKSKKLFFPHCYPKVTKIWRNMSSGYIGSMGKLTMEIWIYW